MQVGDPFTEKLLLEACLELMETDAIVAIQDMGAAGLTELAVEMAGRGGHRHRASTSTRCRVREAGMTPYEMLLSESQERMLSWRAPGPRRLSGDLRTSGSSTPRSIGRVTDDGLFRVRWPAAARCARCRSRR